jgi:hypothetical protein
MDEARFHATRAAVVTRHCIFEKALLARCADCAMAERHALAEREAIACSSPVARANCEVLRELLRERCAFALKLAPSNERLAHAVAMKLACGGLQGVGNCVHRPPDDVHGIVLAAQERYGSLLDLPWPAIVESVARWEGRRRQGKGSAR